MSSLLLYYSLVAGDLSHQTDRKLNRGTRCSSISLSVAELVQCVVVQYKYLIEVMIQKCTSTVGYRNSGHRFSRLEMHQMFKRKLH